jgi:hypothetical protein
MFVTAIGTAITAFSLAALSVLVIFKSFKKRKFGLLILVVLICLAAVLLHRFFGFIEVDQQFSAKSAEDFSYAPYIALYLSMILGMLSEYLYTRFSSPQELRLPFDFGVFVSPILISPILFVPLYETLSNVVTPSRATGMLVLVAFENGFFFKGYFDQRRALHHEEKAV